MSHGHGSVDYVRKFFVLFCLFGALLGLYQLAPNSQHGIGLLALGFVILSAFLIGQVVEIIKLPHITGYLLAGVFLGPSLGETLHKIDPSIHLLPPFNHGILNSTVIENLALLDTLALPLICITAGGALQPEEIKKAFRPIMGILTGQVITMFIGMMGLFYLMSGPIPLLALPAIQGLSLPAILGLGAVVAAVSIATSDAATIAIVVGTKAKGPMTTNVVSVAVLKDIVVVVAFAATTVIATSALGLDSGTSLGDSILKIFLSAVLGVVLGYLIRLYMRYVNTELLLFVITLIYTISFVCDYFHLESALLFIAAGFVVANGPNKGGQFIAEIEKLSTPVFVVFFTIAGAKLHLDVLVEMALFAFLLVAVRSLAFYIGCRVGAVLTNADAASRDYAWMGFVSQAGLAITLANSFIPVYGQELGSALFSFILGGVAIHEIIGPALLQIALQKAGEIPSTTEDSPEKDEQDVQDTTSSFTDPKLSEFASKVELICNTYLTQIEQSFDVRMKALSDNKYDLHTLLDGFTYQMILDIDQKVEEFPSHSYAEFEQISFEKNPNDSYIQSLLRHIQKIRHKIKPRKRDIDVRNLVRYHVGGKFVGALQPIFIEMSKIDRKWALLYSERNFEITDAQQDHDVFMDGVRRKFRILKHQFILDLRLISTIDLRSWQRRTSLIFDERNRTQIFLSKQIDLLQTHIHLLWQKVILQNLVQENLHILLEQIRVREVHIPKINVDEKINWASYYEETKQIFDELSYLPREIEQYLHMMFHELPTTIQYTPQTIDITFDDDTTTNIQLQSNLIHLLEQTVQVQLEAISETLHYKFTMFLKQAQEIIEIQAKDTDNILHSSIERYQNRIIESQDDIEESIQNYQSNLRAFIKELIPEINNQFSKNPTHSQLLIETSNIWQNFIATAQKEIVEFRNIFSPIVLPNYEQLIHNDKLGYPKLFLNMLLHESTDALIHSKDSIIFVGTPTQITQLISEVSDEIPNHVLSLQNKKVSIKTTYICPDISCLTTEMIVAIENFVINKGRAIVGIPHSHWTYIQKKYALHKIMKQIRILPAFTQQNIQEIILHRHNFSGYQLQFSINRKYIFDPIFNISTQSRFFMWLHENSHGNIALAIAIWIQCIKSIKEDTLIIDYGKTQEFMNSLSDETLILLRQIIRFSTITHKDLEYWYGCSPREATIKITALIHDELLEEVPTLPNYFRIPLYKQPLIEILLKKHGWSL